VDVISPHDLDDLASKLGDPSSFRPDYLLLEVISRLLYSSAATVTSPKVDSASLKIAANLQKLKDLMVSIKKEKVADLFPLGSVMYGDGDQVVDKDLFQKKLVTDALVKPEEANEILSIVMCDKDITKVSLNKVEG